MTNERYRVRDNGDGSFGIERNGSLVFGSTTDRVYAEHVRNELNAALDADDTGDADLINQSDEE